MKELPRAYLKRKGLFVPLIVIAILCVGYQGQAQKTDPTRQTWDYKFVWVDIPQTGPSHWFEDADKELPLPVRMPAKTKEWGAQGWEMVAVTSMMGSTLVGNEFRASTNAIQYVFKRPRQ